VGEGTGLQPLTEPRLLEIPALPFPAGRRGHGRQRRARRLSADPANKLL